jgi:osmotically-inducible protein OsmY
MFGFHAGGYDSCGIGLSSPSLSPSSDPVESPFQFRLSAGDTGEERAMLKRRNDVSDEQLTRQAQQRLGNRGLAPPCQVSVATHQGVITLTGTVEHAHQKQTALSAIRGVSGARGYVSHLTVMEIKRF